MDATVKTGPNHYEILGLTPDASSQDIAQAFAKELSLTALRPMGHLAQVSVAHATLRDPIKRKAYDASLRAEPESEASRLIERLQGASFVARPSGVPEPVEAPSIEAQATFVPAETHRPSPPKIDEPAEPARPRPEPDAGSLTALYFDEMDRARGASRIPDAWKLPALGMGALVLAVGVGAWLGLGAGNGGDGAKPADALNMVPAKTAPQLAVASPPPAAVVEEPAAEQQVRPVVPRTRVAARPVPQLVEPEPTQTDVASQEVVIEPPAEQAPTDAPAAEAVSATMPLPNAVIARTIGRIGYACGEVASTSAVEGKPGVFTVTCTSGHSYRATPLRGRYHFRRLG
ncbi:hypothetical protein LZ016_06565 [Sphingomonas sp. SM33]|uniref:J domain-containing protein n=1 Tax=Sphingomonas telluris TaxID=2907998 RepID=A0ABS9VLB9_9SPHN|nr:hypothetical protein [Sphingomonas telluris]MCH8615762.1 hypothetical protein [Sphingomonas telluris]